MREQSKITPSTADLRPMFVLSHMFNQDSNLEFEQLLLYKLFLANVLQKEI